MAGTSITRRSFALAAVIAAGLGLVACGGTQSQSADSMAADTASAAETKTLVVFAAASLTESLTEAGDLFKAANDGVDISFNFDSSGTLKTQIQEGADCDVFISAGQKQMNQLDASATSGNDEGLDFINHDTRFDILENKVTLCVPDGNPKGIDSFDKLADLLKSVDVKLAIGNADVPVGQYTQKIFKFYNIDETAVADKLTYGANVKEVTTAVSEGCGIIYASDAYSAKLTVAATDTADMCGQVIYPAAILSGSTNQDAAAAFLKYLQGSEASAEFEKVLFTPLSK